MLDVDHPTAGIKPAPQDRQKEMVQL